MSERKIRRSRDLTKYGEHDPRNFILEKGERPPAPTPPPPAPKVHNEEPGGKTPKKKGAP